MLLGSNHLRIVCIDGVLWPSKRPRPDLYDLLDVREAVVVVDEGAEGANHVNGGAQDDEQDERRKLDPQPGESGDLIETEDAAEGAVPVTRSGFVSNEPAAPPENLAKTEHEHQQQFRWWALGIIAALCVFFGLATLFFANFASSPDEVQVASDIAKTSIPTLLTLLGTAVAWAFKSEKD